MCCVLSLSTMSDIPLQGQPTAFRLADLAREIAQVPRVETELRLRLVWEFLRGAKEDGQPIGLLVEQEPEPTGDPRFDAMLAAVAEDLCVHEGQAPPAWVFRAHRFLPVAWWVSNLPSARAMALVHAPASYRRRGVMVDRHDLVSA